MPAASADGPHSEAVYTVPAEATKVIAREPHSRGELPRLAVMVRSSKRVRIVPM
jgi:hypothetical protein